MKNGKEAGMAKWRQFAIRTKEEAFAWLDFEDDGVNLRENYIEMMCAINRKLALGISGARLMGIRDEPKLINSSLFFERLGRDAQDRKLLLVCRKVLANLGLDASPKDAPLFLEEVPAEPVVPKPRDPTLPAMRKYVPRQKRAIMPKPEIADALAEACDCTPMQCRRALTDLVTLGRKELLRCGRFLIPHVCIMKVNHKPEVTVGKRKVLGKEIMVKARPATVTIKAHCRATLKKGVFGALC